MMKALPKNYLLRKLHYFFNKPTNTELHILFVQLATFESAGVKTTSAISEIAKNQSNVYLKEALKSIEKHIKNGADLEAAFYKQSIFDSFIAPSVEAGREAGQLSIVYRNLANILKQQGDVKNRIERALLTPKVGLCIMISGCIAFAKILVPKYADLFAKNNIEMPLLVMLFAKIVNGIIDFLPLWLVIGFIIYKFMSKAKHQYAQTVDTLMIKAPIFGKLYYKQIQYLFALNMHVLLSSGLDIKSSIDQVAKIVPSANLQSSISEISKNFVNGCNVSLAFQKQNESNIFDQTTISLLVAGQEAGRIDVMFQKASEIYESEISAMLDAVEMKLTALALLPLVAMVLLFYYMSLMPALGYMRQMIK